MDNAREIWIVFENRIPSTNALGHEHAETLWRAVDPLLRAVSWYQQEPSVRAPLIFSSCAEEFYLHKL